MNYRLAYGVTGLTIKLPDSYDTDLIEPIWIGGKYDQQQAITEALRDPYNSKPLRERVKPGDRVGIIFSDVTRATPYQVILPPLLDELHHVPQENITFFCANGTHRFVTGYELINILGKEIVDKYKILQNDANNPDDYEYTGTTASGNEIFLKREILKCDIKILTGFIEPHFFAGFSGGGKALIPGLAYISSIKFNHSIKQLSLDKVAWGITDGNPLWEEIMEAAEFVPELFLLNITLNKYKDITNVFAGELRTAQKAGCRFVKESAMAPVERLYDIVITSNSGYPLDLNVYQAVKGMSAAAQIVKPGGSIIIAAECSDGIPANSDYEIILKSVRSVNDLMDFITENEISLKDTWQIFFQASIQKKAKVFMYSTKIDHKTIKTALLDPVDDIPELVQELARKTGPETSICILPEGPQTIPYLK